MQATGHDPAWIAQMLRPDDDTSSPLETRPGGPSLPDKAAGLARISGSHHGANLDEDQHVMRMFAEPQFFMHGAEFHVYETRRRHDAWQGRNSNAAVTGQIGHKGH